MNKVRFIEHQITEWIGTLMRDLEGRNAPVDIEDVAQALRSILNDIEGKPSKEDYNNFLEDIERRSNEEN